MTRPTTATTPMLPADRWPDLTLVARVEVDGADYVVYADGLCTWAVDELTWDLETEEVDYSEWCAGSGAGVADEVLCSQIAAAARLDGIYSCGSAVWCPAAKAWTYAGYWSAVLGDLDASGIVVEFDLAPWRRKSSHDEGWARRK